jgi:hypothetical protein
MAADLTALREAISERATIGFEAALQESGIELQVAAPYLTGETVNSLVVELSGAPPNLTGRIAFTTPQALWTDQGTAPHSIDGNPYLSFNIDGRQVVVTHVDHPGTVGTGWFSDNVTPILEAQLARQLAEAFA